MFFFKRKEEKPAPKNEVAKQASKTPKKPAKAAKPVKPAKSTAKPVKKTVTEAAQPEKAIARPAPAQQPAQPEAMPTIPKATPREIREKLHEGWLRAMITFELVGKPREHIEMTIRGYVENVKNDGRVLSISEEFADAIEHDDGMFSAFVEMEALVMDLDTLTWLAFNFQPASIEILEPERLVVEGRNITNWCNDLISKLHEMSGLLREEQSVTAAMTQSLNALIRNAILLALRQGEKTPQELQQLTGIMAEQLEPFLQHLVEKGTVRKAGDKYALA